MFHIVVPKAVNLRQKCCGADLMLRW